jgi:broad specificity phosphatase PhoE
VTVLLLARHGETDWNRERRWQGHADPPLNERGRSQAHALARELEGETIEAVYTSDLARARETAEIVAERLGVAVVAIPELRELNFGALEGLTATEVEERFPGALEAYRDRGEAPPDGESPAELAERTLAAVRRIAAEHPAGTVLVVAHGGSIRTLAAASAALDYADYWRLNPTLANCAVARLSYRDGALRPLD